MTSTVAYAQLVHRAINTDVMLKLLCAVSFYMYVLFFAFLSLVSYTFVDWSSCLNPVKKTPCCFVPARVVVV